MGRGGASLHVGVLAYEDCFASEVFGLIDLFTMADLIAQRTVPGGVRFRTSILGRRRRVRAAGGHELAAEALDTGTDALVVPGFRLPDAGVVDSMLGRLAPEVAEIRERAGAGTPVASVCVGAFLLGEAGLLAGRRATTSWLFADVLQSRHQDARVDADPMIVSEDGITTTAAFSAVHDLALRFVRQHGGDVLARQVARLTLVADNRHSQTPYVDDSLVDLGEDRMVREVKHWLLDRLDEPYDLAALAASFHVSTRTMLRRFAHAAGQSPLEFLRAARVEAAKRLLESPEHTVASAMEQVGYSDVASFRRMFARHTGMAPGVYKANFRSSASAAAGWRRK